MPELHALTRPSRLRSGAASAWVELMGLATLLALYSLTRVLVDTDVSSAQVNAANLIRFEALFDIDIEAGLSSSIDQRRLLAVAMSFWYATLPYAVTAGTLLRLYRRHGPRSGKARTALVFGSAIALIGYALLPTSPPRLMPGGYVDVLASTANVGWWSGHASAPAGFAGFTNELAAMPSLHVGWAVWVAWAMWPVVGRRGHLAGCLYAAGTFVVVVGTGNHWVVDGVAGIIVILAGIFITRRFGSTTAPHTYRGARRV